MNYMYCYVFFNKRMNFAIKLTSIFCIFLNVIVEIYIYISEKLKLEVFNVNCKVLFLLKKSATNLSKMFPSNYWTNGQE